MRIKLYKPFEHWYHGGTIYLYSDPHFGDPDSESIDPNWPDSDTQVKMINEGLGKNDTIIFLGDIGDESYIKKIKGYKVLLLGNHDRGASNYMKSYEVSYDFGDKIVSYTTNSYDDAKEAAEEMRCESSAMEAPIIRNNGLFDEVYEGPLFINEKICLSHEPVGIGFGVNIHGHNHRGKFKEMTFFGKRYISINICSDVVKFKKMRLDDLVEGLPMETIHRTVIDNAIEGKRFREKFNMDGFTNDWVDC